MSDEKPMPKSAMIHDPVAAYERQIRDLTRDLAEARAEVERANRDNKRWQECFDLAAGHLLPKDGKKYTPTDLWKSARAMKERAEKAEREVSETLLADEERRKLTGDALHAEAQVARLSAALERAEGVVGAARRMLDHGAVPACVSLPRHAGQETRGSAEQSLRDLILALRAYDAARAPDADKGGAPCPLPGKAGSAVPVSEDAGRREVPASGAEAPAQAEADDGQEDCYACGHEYGQHQEQGDNACDVCHCSRFMLAPDAASPGVPATPASDRDAGGFYPGDDRPPTIGGVRRMVDTRIAAALERVAVACEVRAKELGGSLRGSAQFGSLLTELAQALRTGTKS